MDGEAVAASLDAILLKPVIQFQNCAISLIFQVIPRVRGDWLVGSVLFRMFQWAGAFPRLSLERATFKMEIVLDLRDPPQYSLVRNGNFDALALSALHAHLQAGDTFVDVGANWGYFTCVGSRSVGPRGAVLALEPNHRAYSRLLSTINANNLHNTIPLPFAAWSHSKTHLSLKEIPLHQSTSSFVRVHHSQRGGVIAVTVDEVIEKLNVASLGAMKIDTEGCELRVLEGARQALERWRPFLLVEVSPLCSRFGYTMRDLYSWMNRTGYTKAYVLDERRGEIRQIGDDIVEGQVAFLHNSAFPSPMFLGGR